MVNTHRHSTLPFNRYASFTIHHSPFAIYHLYFQRLAQYHQWEGISQSFVLASTTFCRCGSLRGYGYAGFSGDGLVVGGSARLNGVPSYDVSVGHGDMGKDNAVLEIVKNLLQLTSGGNWLRSSSTISSRATSIRSFRGTLGPELASGLGFRLDRGSLLLA